MPPKTLCVARTALHWSVQFLLLFGTSLPAPPVWFHTVVCCPKVDTRSKVRLDVVLYLALGTSPFFPWFFRLLQFVYYAWYLRSQRSTSTTYE